MHRHTRTSWPLLLAATLLADSQIVTAAPAHVAEAELRRHIDILASDEFEGRKPGTAGETKTLAYLSRQLAALGLVGGAADGGWYQPVPLVQRRPFAHRALWSGPDGALALGAGELILIGKDATESLADAPVWYVGRGSQEDLAGKDLRGAVVLLNIAPSSGSGGQPDRQAALLAAGVAAIIGVFGEQVPWQAVTASFGQGQDRLATESIPEIGGAMPIAAVRRLAGTVQLGDATVRLPVRVTLDVSTAVNRYESYNVIARLPGTARGGESVLVLGHWDHLGLCRPEGTADRICNGAVDNASGLAMMIEAARHLARGRRPARDILFMGTTAEESGLLGAEHYAAQKPVGVVAAINIDTVAIAPRGLPVAIVGRGTTPLDPLVDATARALGRKVDADLEANAFIQRQDGWELTQAGIPTVMVGGSFSDLGTLGAFLSGPYHKPDDDLSRPIELGGAAEDTELTVALVRKLADPAQYPAGAR
jgi:hypothetical protein